MRYLRTRLSGEAGKVSHQLDLSILEIFSNLNTSKILWFLGKYQGILYPSLKHLKQLQQYSLHNFITTAYHEKQAYSMSPLHFKTFPSIILQM